jgi:hypothetical protein
MAQRGKSFAADMKSAPVAGPPKPKARSPFVDYDEAGNALNPQVGKGPSSPFRTMKKGDPVPTAYSGTPGSKIAQTARDVGQTLADTYHLGDKPLPWQTAAKKNGKKNGGKANGG